MAKNNQNDEADVRLYEPAVNSPDGKRWPGDPYLMPPGHNKEKPKAKPGCEVYDYESDRQFIASLNGIRKSMEGAAEKYREQIRNRSQLRQQTETEQEERQKRWETEPERVEAQRKAAIQERLRTLYASAGARYHRCTLENFTTEVGSPQHSANCRKVLGMVREYCETIEERIRQCEGLVLYGKVGTGKDHLAFCVMRAAAQYAERIAWQNGISWYSTLRDGIKENTLEEDLLSRLWRPQVLCLSDPLPPLAERLTDHQSSMLYQLIQRRYESGRLTIVTLNVDDDATADASMGEATWDRLCHNAWKGHCDWPSYRKPKREVG